MLLKKYVTTFIYFQRVKTNYLLICCLIFYQYGGKTHRRCREKLKLTQLEDDTLFNPYNNTEYNLYSKTTTLSKITTGETSKAVLLILALFMAKGVIDER